MSMAKFDLKNNLHKVKAFNAAISTDTTTNGDIVDTKGYRSVTFLFFCQARTDGTYTPQIQDGDDSSLSDAAAVADTYLIGTEAAAQMDAANEVFTIGYSGPKRYVRPQIVSASTSSGATIVCVVLLGSPEDAPVS